MRTGEVLWHTGLGTSVQRFPLTYTTGDEQYVAVSTETGGVSPRNVPDALSPEILYPQAGNAL